MYASQKIANEKCQPRLIYFLLARSACIWLGSFTYGKCSGIDFEYFGLTMFKQFPENRKSRIFWRSFYGYGSYISAMISIHLLPVSVSISITMSAVFATVLLGYLVAGERISAREVITIIGGTLGVVMLTNPLLFNKRNPNSNLVQREHSEHKQYPHYEWGIFFGILFAIFSAMNLISIRSIGGNIHSSINNYYFGLLSTIITLMVAAYTDPLIFKLWKMGTPHYIISIP